MTLSVHRAGRVRAEATLLLRAGASSLAATVADGVVYQVILAIGRGAHLHAPYLGAAAAGATFGAVTNFGLNRWWAFGSRNRPLFLQSVHYAAGSLLTLLVLSAALWLFVDRLGFDARAAWLPAKVLAWAAFSYPFQRMVVFAGAPR